MTFATRNRQTLVLAARVFLSNQAENAARQIQAKFIERGYLKLGFHELRREIHSQDPGQSLRQIQNHPRRVRDIYQDAPVSDEYAVEIPTGWDSFSGGIGNSQDTIACIPRGIIVILARLTAGLLTDHRPEEDGMRRPRKVIARSDLSENPRGLREAPPARGFRFVKGGLDAHDQGCE